MSLSSSIRLVVVVMMTVLVVSSATATTAHETVQQDLVSGQLTAIAQRLEAATKALDDIAASLSLEEEYYDHITDPTATQSLVDGRVDWFFILLLLHEMWIMLQHANILLNPLCQRLDRNFGIALLKQSRFWVIAGVLAAYWLREVASMILAYTYLDASTNRTARVLILMSCVYHVFKVVSISIDGEY